MTDNDIKAFFDRIGAGDIDGVRGLLEAAPELLGTKNEHGLSPLLWALYNRKPELARSLCDAGYAPNLFESCALGEQRGVTRALRRDPKLVTARSQDGFTLLHLACYFGHGQLVELLLKAGSDTNATADNPSGVAPVHSAAASTLTPILIQLLEAGARPDSRQHGGYTALMSAALHANVEMATALVEAGADASLTADDGRSALSIAEGSGNAQLLDAVTGSR